MKNSIYIFFILIIGLGRNSYCQDREIDSLRRVISDSKQNDTVVIKAVNWLSWKYYNYGKFDSAINAADKALRLSKANNYTRGMLSAHVNLGNVYSDKGDYNKAIENNLMALNLAEGLGYEKGIANVSNNLGIIFYKMGNYPEALNYYFKSLKVSEETGNKPGIARTKANLGFIYRDMGNLDEALKNYDETLLMDRDLKDTVKSAMTYNSIGVIYFKKGKYQQALDTEKIALKLGETIKSKEIIGRTHEDMGKIKYAMGAYTDALEDFQQSLDIYTEIGNKMEIGSIYGNIGMLELARQNLPIAKEDLVKSLEISKGVEDKKNIRDVYQSLVQLDSAEHNPGAAFADYKSYITYRDSIINEANTRKMVSEQMTYEFDKQRRSDSIQVAKRQAIQKSEQEEKDAILIGSFVLAFLFAGIFFFQRRRMATELAKAKIHLDNYVKNMEEKNKLLDEFRTDIDKLKTITDDRRVAQLEHLNNISILTDGDWTQFRLLFEQVYPSFFTHLKNKLPDLTQGEIRLICLTKLNIGTKQMAGILGVSDDTIRKTRYRLRKKLGLEGEDGIDDIVNSI